MKLWSEEKNFSAKIDKFDREQGANEERSLRKKRGEKLNSCYFGVISLQGNL